MSKKIRAVCTVIPYVIIFWSPYKSRKQPAAAIHSTGNKLLPVHPNRDILIEASGAIGRPQFPEKSPIMP